MKNYAVILASGSGERTGLNIPKQFALLSGKTVLEHTIDKFDSHNDIDAVIIVGNPLFLDLINNILNNSNYKKIKKVIAGGATRQLSSYIGVNSISEENANVLIHDAARPFISKKIISDCIEALNNYQAVNVTVESSDTIVQIDDSNIIKTVPDRRYLRRCQTPQAFDLQLIKQAHLLAKNDGIDNMSDDCGLILKYNLADIITIQGSSENIKITYPIDLEIAELILKKESR